MDSAESRFAGYLWRQYTKGTIRKKQGYHLDYVRFNDDRIECYETDTHTTPVASYNVVGYTEVLRSYGDSGTKFGCGFEIKSLNPVLETLKFRASEQSDCVMWVAKIDSFLLRLQSKVRALETGADPFDEATDTSNTGQFRTPKIYTKASPYSFIDDRKVLNCNVTICGANAVDNDGYVCGASVASPSFHQSSMLSRSLLPLPEAPAETNTQSLDTSVSGNRRRNSNTKRTIDLAEILRCGGRSLQRESVRQNTTDLAITKPAEKNIYIPMSCLDNQEASGRAMTSTESFPPPAGQKEPIVDPRTFSGTLVAEPMLYKWSKEEVHARYAKASPRAGRGCYLFRYKEDTDEIVLVVQTEDDAAKEPRLIMFRVKRDRNVGADNAHSKMYSIENNPDTYIDAASLRELVVFYQSNPIARTSGNSRPLFLTTELSPLSC